MIQLPLIIGLAFVLVVAPKMRDIKHRAEKKLEHRMEKRKKKRE